MFNPFNFMQRRKRESRHMCVTEHAIPAKMMPSPTSSKIVLPGGAFFQPANEYEELMFPSLVYDLAKEKQSMKRTKSKSTVVESRQCGVILTKHNCSSASLEHTYEDVLSPPQTVNNNKDITDKKSSSLLAFKSLSDTDLRKGFKMADTELEVCAKTNNFLESDRLGDITFNTYGTTEPEQGFYKCHDNLEDIDELDLIPDLFSARKSHRAVRQQQTTSIDSQPDTCQPLAVEKDTRRNSFDSGRGSSTSTLIRTDPQCSRNCLCSSCCSISPGKLSLDKESHSSHEYENFLFPPKRLPSPPPPPLPPKQNKKSLQLQPTLPPKPSTTNNSKNVEESVRALQSLSNDLLGLIESAKKDTSTKGITLTEQTKTEEAPKSQVARTLDFEEVGETPSTPKSRLRNKGLFRSLRKDSPALKKVINASTPSISIVRKRKYLLCSPKIKAATQSPFKSSPRKKKVKKVQETDKENAEPSPDFSSFKARAVAANLPVIPFYLTPEESLATTTTPKHPAAESTDDYVEMTPQPTPVSRKSFLGDIQSKGHCRSCTCPDHKARRLPPPPPVVVKHTQL